MTLLSNIINISTTVCTDYVLKTLSEPLHFRFNTPIKP